MSGYKVVPKTNKDGSPSKENLIVSNPLVVESLLPSNFVKLMNAYDDAVSSRDAWDTLVADAATKIAELTCPFAVGDIIFTDSGLGKNGLVVDAVFSPVEFSDSNKWALRTFAQTLKMEPSNRMVMVQEFQMVGSAKTLNVMSVTKTKR